MQFLGSFNLLIFVLLGDCNHYVLKIAQGEIAQCNSGFIALDVEPFGDPFGTDLNSSYPFYCYFNLSCYNI